MITVELDIVPVLILLAILTTLQSSYWDSKGQTKLSTALFNLGTAQAVTALFILIWRGIQ